MRSEPAAPADRTDGDGAGLGLADLLAMNQRLRGFDAMPGNRPPVGQRAGRRRAQGLDLDGLSAYVPGDDVRAIDWRASARSSRIEVRRYMADAHIVQLVVIDLRKEMLFGTRTRPMAKTAALAAARIGWQALRLGEPVGLLVVPQGIFLPPRRGRAWLLEILGELVAIYGDLRAGRDPGPIDWTGTELRIGRLAPGDGLVWISDFEGAGTPPPVLIANLGRRFDGLAILVEDPVSREPPPRGRYPLRTRAQEEGPPAIARIGPGAPQASRDARAARRRALETGLLDAAWRLAEADDLVISHG